MTDGRQEQVGEAKEIGFWFGSLGDGGAIRWDKELEEKQVWERLRKSKDGRLQSGECGVREAKEWVLHEGGSGQHC